MLEIITPIVNTNNNEKSFPKRMRSASAKLFSINYNSSNESTKRSSCCQTSLGGTDDHHNTNTILNPSKWFPRIRCRSSSSASSTFSIVFSSSSAESSSHNNAASSSHNNAFLSFLNNNNNNAAVIDDALSAHTVSLETASSELEQLYNDAKIEVDFATESQGSIYYEGDLATAHAAFKLCLDKYNTAMKMFENSTISIKFKFRWETDLHQLLVLLNSLPDETKEEEKVTSYMYYDQV